MISISIHLKNILYASGDDLMIFEKAKELIQTRRSIRNYLDTPVPKEDILDILDCARYAPSDTNSQTWEFIVISNKEIINKIEEYTWESLRNIAESAKQNGKEKEGKLLLRSFGPYATAFSGAPALIICLATPYTSKFREKIFDPIGFVDESVWHEEGIKSSTLAAQNIMLAAHAKGLATCPMTGPVLLAQKEIAELLDIPKDKTINLVLALGYPERDAKAPQRKEIDEIARFID
jgi:nitroreductase